MILNKNGTGFGFTHICLVGNKKKHSESVCIESEIALRITNIAEMVLPCKLYLSFFSGVGDNFCQNVIH